MSNKVTDKTFYYILKHAMDDKNNQNYGHALRLIKANLTTEALELLLDLLSSESLYKPLQAGDYVMVEMDSWHAKNHFNYDTLKEMGLVCPKTDMVYAKILKDGSWSSGFNPYYGTMKVEYLYHDDEGKLKYHEHLVNTVSVTKIDKLDIPYFKNLNHGKNIQRLIKDGDKKLGDIEENVSQTSS